MNRRVLLAGLECLESQLDEALEFGSGGMMRQSRKLASLSRANDPEKVEAARNIAGRILGRLKSAEGRSYNAPTLGGIEEKLDLTEANRRKIGRYQARLGMKPSAE